MLRKVTLGLIAATALTLAAAAPAAAGPFHHHHHHGHWGHGWGHGFGVGFGGVYLNTGYGYNDCLQQRWIETRRGLRLRTVNVCAY
ncbi:hypothetical protein [Bradyrhizobium sp. AUGA SZCCT0431]|uniref:hypothetical protein n=1 Tax=Bradyrhizobium sp. AUGA SZCCT0431 TaxID=2807674 RepID=UPI001BA6DF16|nr:hypothetical protein [Bradyrhizobium sp. AUGA SZCCT0431]MBR1148231.1 hypothetical protein [Bradyrhizobium sp. AUGA SZCCT0431]